MKKPLTKKKVNKITFYIQYILFSEMVLIAAGIAQAATVNWKNVDGDWANGANWSTNSKPAADDQVYITRPGKTVTLTSNESIHSIRITSGNLTLDGGDLQTTGKAVWFGSAAGETSTVTVKNGSTWTHTGTDEFYVGYHNDGEGILNIESTGTVNAGRFSVGSANDGQGTANVSGTLNTDRVTIGSAGKGTLNIDGGTVNTGTGVTTPVSIGSTATGKGEVNVTNGGNWSVTGGMTIGGSGNGKLLVDNGQVNSTGLVTIGNNNGGSGSVVVNSNGIFTSDTAQLGNYHGSVGTVDINGGSWTVQNYIRVGNYGEGRLTIDNGGTVTGKNIVVGNSSTGEGILNLNNGTIEANRIYQGTGSGSFTIDGGTVKATANASRFIDGFNEVTIGSNGATIDSNGFNVTSTSAFSGTGDLTKKGTGTLTLANASSNFTGNTIVNGGGLNLTVADAIANSATVHLKNNSSLTAYADQQFQDLRMDVGTSGINMNGYHLTLNKGELGAVVRNANTVTKNTTDTLNLNIADVLAGATTVDLTAGNIESNYNQTINNLISHTGTRFDVGNANTLTINNRLIGTGTLAGQQVVLGHNAVVSTGHNTIGILNIEGDLVFQAGARYEVETNPTNTTDSDFIRVTGTADLTGGTVHHIGLNGNYLPIGEWKILEADNGLNGTQFAGLDQTYLFLDGQLIYGSDGGLSEWVKLQLTRNDVALTDYAYTPNQIATATGINGLKGTNNTLYNKVLGLSTQTNIADVYDQLSGEIHASLHGALLDYDRGFSRAMLQRLTHKGARQGYPLWLTVDSYNNNANRGKGYNTARSKMNTTGFTIGGETMLNKWVVGSALRYGNSDLKVNKRHSSADIDSYSLGVYAARAFGQWQLNLGGLYSWHEVDTERRIVEPSLAQILKSNYSVQSLQLFSELGYRIQLTDKTTVEPYLGVAWNQSRSKGFHEKGLDAALKARKVTNENVTSTVGTRFQLQTAGKVSLELDLNWQHLYGDKTPDTRLSFYGSNRFTINGAPVSRNALGTRLGALVTIAPKTNLRVGYDGLYGGATESHGGYLTLEYTF